MSNIICLPNNTVDVVYMEIILHRGMSSETKHTLGFEHLIEHLIYQNTETYKHKLNDELLKRGIVFNGMTTDNYVKYWFYANKDHTEFLIDVIYDFMNVKKFSRASVNKEKQIVIEEISMDLDDPNYNLVYNHNKILFPNNSISAHTSEIISNTKKCTSTKLISNYKSTYSPNKCTLIVAGNFDKEYIELYAREYMRMGRKVKIPNIVLDTPKKKTIIKHVESKDISKTYCILSFYDKVHENDYLIAEIVSDILKLLIMDIVRERLALIYGVKCQFDVLHNRTTLTIDFNTKQENFKKSLKKILHIVHTHKISKKIMKTITNKIKMKKTDLVGQYDLKTRAEFVSDRIVHNLPVIDIETYYDNLLAVTLEDINIFREKYLDRSVLTYMSEDELI